MTEDIVDILIYLYENYMESDQSAPPDQDTLREELLLAGFPDTEVDKAFQWLSELASQHPLPPAGSHPSRSLRIYAAEEAKRLGPDCQGLLLYLEQCEILDPAGRELVIDRALALNTNQVSPEDLKWVVLLVLLNQPGRENCLARMEDLVYSEEPAYLH